MARKELRWCSISAQLPHPAKTLKGGEDAFFISQDGLAFGVADGELYFHNVIAEVLSQKKVLVGGWHKVLIPASFQRE